MGSYLAADRITAARTSGAQHRSMNPAPSLEQAADAFLTDAERRQPPRRYLGCRRWTLRNRRRRRRARLASRSALRPDRPRSLLPRKGRLHPGRQKGVRCMPRTRRVSTICKDNDERFGIWGGLSERGTPPTTQAWRAKPGRYNPHADCATVLPPNLPTRGDRHPPLLLRGLHRNHR